MKTMMLNTMTTVNANVANTIVLPVAEAAVYSIECGHNYSARPSFSDIQDFGKKWLQAGES